MTSPPVVRRQRTAGNPVSHTIQPACDRAFSANSPGVLRENQERGLEGILSLVGIGQHPAADSPDHRSMSIDEGREGGLGDLSSPRCELLQKMLVGEVALSPGLEQGVNLMQDGRSSPALARQGLASWSGPPMMLSDTR